jgi:ABC-type phosphate transport system permease subunit
MVVLHINCLPLSKDGIMAATVIVAASSTLIRGFYLAANDWYDCYESMAQAVGLAYMLALTIVVYVIVPYYWHQLFETRTPHQNVVVAIADGFATAIAGTIWLMILQLAAVISLCFVPLISWVTPCVLRYIYNYETCGPIGSGVLW